MRAVFIAALFALTRPQTAPVAAPVAVVVELFTSEGCSSCPPADALLSRVSKTQPLAGVRIIPIGLHVTYWDQLGWKDPASLALATERQHDYGRLFGEDRIYTPQAVVDGRDELVGSDEAALRRAVLKAAQQPHARVDLKVAVNATIMTADAFVSAVPASVKEPLHVWMVITEDGLSSVVKRGENNGHTLHHDGVARAIFGGALKQASQLSFRAELQPRWQRDQLRVAVLLQGETTGRIWAAATAPIQ